ncbi:hypothetical protein V1506DRAFT_547744 [Lipomyces tetrasporus]
MSCARKGPEVCAQCLVCPMLDDQMKTISSRQFVNEEDFMPREVFAGVWSSAFAKEQEHDRQIVPPGRVGDLSALPTTYLDTGSAELLRHEKVPYASKLWEKGV